jgi:hypothetical protein
MLIERRIQNGRIELWEYEWAYLQSGASHKTFLRRLGIQQPLAPDFDAGHEPAEAICWAYGRTLGNIAVFTQEVLGSFTAMEGSDAKLSCDFVAAGKFRHGPERWWCRTHQCHWGNKADLAAAQQAGSMVCAEHNQPMCYKVNPPQVKLDEHVEVGIWCAMPPAISSEKDIKSQPPQIHMHFRDVAGGTKTVDSTFNAVSLHYNQNLGLFNNKQITKVNLTPPAALEYMLAIEEGRELNCINCSHCGYPHLDLGSFARVPHRKHFCGNCGRDSTWSKQAIISTPLKPLNNQFSSASQFIFPDRELNLDDYDGCNFEVWASTPAILWTAERPQEKGIHVHLKNGTKWIEDNTFREVIYQGKSLDRIELLKTMITRTII